MVARRAVALEAKITEIGGILAPLVKDTAPELVSTLGLGTDIASALLVAAGDNPSDCATKPPSLISAAPLRSTPAAASKNATGSTAAAIARANSALWHIVITRMVYDLRTTEYIEWRTNEGLTKK